MMRRLELRPWSTKGARYVARRVLLKALVLSFSGSCRESWYLVVKSSSSTSSMKSSQSFHLAQRFSWATEQLKAQPTAAQKSSVLANRDSLLA